MKITVKFSEATEPYYDNASPYEVKVETKEETKVFSINEGEPEDMSFGRNLNDVFKIPGLLKLAYKAGKNGEEIEIVEEEYDW